MNKSNSFKTLLLTCCAVSVLTAASGAWAIDNCAQITATVQSDTDSTPNDKTDPGGDSNVTRNNILAAVNANTAEDDEACVPLPIEVIHDFGDAPDSYLTTAGAGGARHEIVPWLRLGAAVDHETDVTLTNNNATDDGDDEDGVVIPALTAGQTAPVFTATATNTTAADAFLACWVDYNGNGQFDTDEFGSATVPANSTDAPISVNMPNVPLSAYTDNKNGDGSSSYARCRLSNVELAAANAADVLDDGTNGVSDGEVEDYAVTFTKQPVLDVALVKRPASVNDVAVTDVANVTVKAGDKITFTLEVINQGAVDATGIVITDYIPAGLTLDDENWIDNTDGTATLKAPFDLAVADSSKTVDITFTVAADAAPGSIINAAEISAVSGVDNFGNPLTDVDSTPNTNPDDETDVEDDVTDNSDTDNDNLPDEDDHDIASVTVEALVDVSLTKAVEDTSGSAVTSARRGDTVVYVLTVTNDGPNDATGVVVNDLLPEGVTYQSDDATANNMSYDNASGQWDVGDLPKTESRTLKITVTID
ncbi:MAG: hypothetical protein CSA79_05685 [Thiothrix nivea]|nr:MAG: hypothetical protein CSA79_05685 [Thiothrix nivea]